MGKLKKILVVVLLIASVSTIAQEYKFGKVSKEELLEASYPLDSSANAAVLYENKRVHIAYNQTDGFQLVTEVFKRIKLYNKKGFDNASEEIYLFKSGSNEETVNGLKAVTYTWQDGKIIETKLKKDGIFKSEYSENYNVQKFTMPALAENSVIEFKYKIVSPYISHIDRIYLQYKIPIKKQKVTFSSPEYYNYKKFSSGYLPINLKESKSQGRITINSKTRTGGGFGPSRTNFHSDNISHTVNKSTIVSNNVPAFIEEPFCGNAQNYISSITYELSFVQFPNQAVEYRSSTWEKVTQTVYKSTRFGDELKKINYFKEDIDNILQGVHDPQQKAVLIYNFVKNKMTWNNRRSVFTNEGVKKAYKEGMGNAAEINLMLTSMLNYANLDANPILVSTSDRLISLFPTINGFNYVITRVRFPDGKIIYLDATDKYGLFNILPDRVTRGIGRVIAKNGTSQMVDFRPQKPSDKRYRMQCEFDNEGTLKGKLYIHHTDYQAHRFRVENAEKSDQGKIKNFEKTLGLTEIEEYTTTGLKEYGKGVVEKFNFAVEDQIEMIADEIFFSPLLFFRNNENIFKSEERKYPIDFGYGFSNKYMINIKVPEGYAVAECPKSQAFKLPENMGKFVFRSNVVNNVIQLVVEETINNSLIAADDYPIIKELYNQIIQKENEQVVLKKI